MAATQRSEAPLNSIVTSAQPAIVEHTVVAADGAERFKAVVATGLPASREATTAIRAVHRQRAATGCFGEGHEVLPSELVVDRQVLVQEHNELLSHCTRQNTTRTVIFTLAKRFQ